MKKVPLIEGNKRDILAEYLEEILMQLEIDMEDAKTNNLPNIERNRIAREFNILVKAVKLVNSY